MNDERKNIKKKKNFERTTVTLYLKEKNKNG
jgi:hypothetical protein